jgi:sialic acid synthase SpsE
MKPLIVAEIGINHDGDYYKAVKMIEDAARVGCKCVKFQCHVLDDEYVPAAKQVIPANADKSIYDIMARCALSEDDEWKCKHYTESLGMMYLCTPFSRAAADRLHWMDVQAFKIGSGECNNYPLVEYIAKFGKPIILSTGMNNLETITPAVEIIERAGLEYGLLHCTSIYPCPYDKVNLGAMAELKARFPRAHVGLSDHSIGNYISLAAVTLGAEIIEKHFTSDKYWPGPDNSMSIEPYELKQLIEGAEAITKAMGGSKSILPEEQPTIDFAYASVVSTRDILGGTILDEHNTWVKRPGTGQIKAKDYNLVLGHRALVNIPKDTQIKWADVYYSSQAPALISEN